MANWVIIGVLAILIFILFVKMKHHRTEKNIRIIMLVIVLILIYISVTSVLNKNDIKISSVNDVGKAVSVYFTWISSTAKTVWHAGSGVVSVVGNAIKGNSTA